MRLASCLKPRRPERPALAGAVAAAALAATTAAHAGGAPRFVDRAPGQAFTHHYEGGWEHFVGGGVAVLDCNGDRLPDLYVAGGTAPAKLLVNTTGAPGDPLSFEHRPARALDLEGVTGAYPLDLDNDARLDLAVLRVGDNVLLRGDGRCGFERLPFDGGSDWTAAFSATWEEGNALPTLAFANYVDLADPDGPFERCAPNRLHRPGPGGYRPALALPGHCALSALFSDWNRSGRADLRVSNDRHYYVRNGAEQLFRMDGEPREYGEADGWRRLSIWGMGIASRDVTGDGLPEVFLTSMGDQKLRVRDPASPGPTYHDESYARGTTAHVPYVGDEGRPSTGWHASFGDVNNDGLDDLFIAKGNVNQMPEVAVRDPNNLLLQMPDGSFLEHGLEAGVASTERGRGGALADLDGDGLLDIVVVNRRAAMEVLQNVTREAGHWLAVDLAQPDYNRHAVGAWIEVTDGSRTWHRELTVGGGHASGVASPAHFGLGAAERVRVRVTWPHGPTTDWMRAPLDVTVRIERGRGLVIVER